MTAIDVEIIVGGDGGGRDMKCIKGRTKEKSQPTTRAAPDGWREARAARRGAAAAAGGSNKVGVPSHKCHRPREIRAGAARKFLPARARDCVVAGPRSAFAHLRANTPTHLALYCEHDATARTNVEERDTNQSVSGSLT